MRRTRDEGWRGRLNLPAYRVGEAAHFAQLSPSVVAYWQNPRAKRGAAIGPRKSRVGLSYLQLVEIAVVAALRKAGHTLAEISDARGFMVDRYGFGHPFAQARFKYDGAEVMLEAIGDERKLVSASGAGQLVWKDVVEQRLREFRYGEDGIVDLWSLRGEDSPIRLDPRIAFGSPHVHGTATWVIKERWRAGESVADISDDYGLDEASVTSALKFEGMEADPSRPSKWSH